MRCFDDICKLLFRSKTCVIKFFTWAKACIKGQHEKFSKIISPFILVMSGMGVLMYFYFRL